jgi:hypothetical protein
MLLYGLDFDLLSMEHASGECCLDSGFCENVREMSLAASSAACNDWDSHRF